MTNKDAIQAQDGPPSDVERIKRESNYLRGTLTEALAEPISSGINDDDNRLMKFHGSYLQDDRDLREERRQQKLEPAYQFMVRVRLPGGVATPEQWLKMDELAHEYGNGTLRLTTRQTFQMHGILKWNMKKSIQGINEALMDTIAACGDVNRNVMITPNPYQSEYHQEVYEYARKLSDDLLPKTRAYHEIWLDEEKVAETPKQEELEPMYGALYLPRKFKIGVAFHQRMMWMSFLKTLAILVIEDGKLQGFNVAVGGGMGMTHGDKQTYPQLGRVIGFCKPDQMVEIAEKLITIQRDYGNRSERKYARFKYTIDKRGLDWLVSELRDRLGWQLGEAKSFQFDHNGDRYGWTKGIRGRWHFTLFVQNGRIKDDADYQLMTGLREIAKVHTGIFVLTGNQNVIISNVTTAKKKQLTALIEQYGLSDGTYTSGLRRNSMACVAFPTCGLAMAESERYLPSLVTKLEYVLDDAGLKDEDITIRMAGCPNGCSRAAIAEIGFIGKAPGKYNLYLGAGFAGERLSKMYKENIGEVEILDTLSPIIHDYSKRRTENERFGDFVIRSGYIKKTESGTDFHN
ncbi:LOW QUALITY PROTEIN: sulfite reductase [Bacillus sp. JCM 19047]|nr:LOW QUALITY PROTEIN: sulfite reductase [Bacillus sp. JCM 19047]